MLCHLQGRWGLQRLGVVSPELEITAVCIYVMSFTGAMRVTKARRSIPRAGDHCCLYICYVIYRGDEGNKVSASYPQSGKSLMLYFYMSFSEVVRLQWHGVESPERVFIYIYISWCVRATNAWPLITRAGDRCCCTLFMLFPGAVWHGVVSPELELTGFFFTFNDNFRRRRGLQWNGFVSPEREIAAVRGHGRRLVWGSEGSTAVEHSGRIRRRRRRMFIRRWRRGLFWYIMYFSKSFPSGFNTFICSFPEFNLPNRHLTL